MPASVIDTIKVRPQGIKQLTTDRYVNVLVDENGNITNQDLPNKAGIDRNCITDYKHRDRSYEPDDEITTFCNRDTFTRYYVYAQNCRPFAYVKTKLNDPSCGYQTPLPEPSVPPNPFGEAYYGLYKFYQDCDIDKRPYRINIYKRGWLQAFTEIKTGSPANISISFGSEEDKFEPIRSSECLLNFTSLLDYEFLEFYSDDERMYKMDAFYTDNADKIFTGFIIPDTAREPFVTAPYNMTLRATDGLGGLKNVTYPFPIGSKLDIKQSFKDILCYCLSATNLNLDLHTISNLYEVKMPNGLNDDPLSLMTVNPTRMADSKGTPVTCYDALETVLRTIGAYIAQVNGVFTVIRHNELGYEKKRRRIYNYKGLLLSSDLFYNNRIAGYNKEVQLINGGHEITSASAYKRVITNLKFGTIPSTVYNGDFEQWDGHNFNGWTRYGGLNFTRVQKSVKTTQGNKVLINDYALQFNEKDNPGKWMEAAPVDTQTGDKFSISFDFFTEKSFGTIGSVLLKLRIKCGSYYLYNEDFNNEKYEWVTTLATCTIEVTQNGVVDMKLPELPEGGQMIIQLYGGTFYTKVYQRVRELNVLKGNNIDTYEKIYIDNVFLNLSRDTSARLRTSTLSVSENYGSYYNSPDPIELLYGDLDPAYILTLAGRPRPTRAGTSNYIQAIQNSYYGINTSDGSYSTAWMEFGQAGAPLPIALHLAKGILKEYQKPFLFFSGDLYGDNINYLNVFTIEKIDGRLFAFQGGTFDIRNKQVTGVSLVEIFATPFPSNDYQIPFNDGDELPPIIQNPNTDIACISDDVWQCPYNDTFGEGTEEYFTVLLSTSCDIEPNVTFYQETELEIGETIFTDTAGTKAPDGFYTDGMNTFQQTGGKITAIGVCFVPPSEIIHLWAKLTESNIQTMNGNTYGDVSVSIYRGNSSTAPPLFTTGNLINYSGDVTVVSQQSARAIAPNFIFKFNNQNTLTQYGLILQYSDGKNLHRKILGTDNNNIPLYLGYITT